MVKKIFIYILVFISVSLNIQAQSLTVQAETDTTDYLVGDYIHYKLILTYGSNYKVNVPPLKDKLGSLELISEAPVEKSEDDSRITEIHEYILAGYDSSSINIPPIKIEYIVGNSNNTQYLESNTVHINVHTLRVNPSSDIKDVREPLRIALGWVFYFILGLIILLILLAAYYFYNKYKRKNTGEVEVVKTVQLSPGKIALKALDELNEKKLWQKGNVKEFHSEITGIIRKYFEDRYNFRALEMTSEEIMQVLDRVMDNQQLIDITREFLSNADLVKFAKFVPMPSVNEEMMKEAYKIVSRTKMPEREEEMLEGANVQ